MATKEESLMMATKSYSTVVSKLSTKMGAIVLFCGECDVPLAITRHQVIFCPKCERSENTEKPEMILCCSECKNPLRVSSGRGIYCETCGFHPSMQDQFFRMIKDL